MAWLLQAWLILTIASCVWVYDWTRIDSAPMPPPAAAEWAIQALEALRAGRPRPPAPEQAKRYANPGPVFVAAWWRGQMRAQFRAEKLVDAVEGATRAFGRNTALTGLPGWPHDTVDPVRFRITVARGYGPLVRFIPMVSTLGIVPLVEGVEAELRGHRSFLTPDQIWARRLYDGAVRTPLPEVNFGVRLPAVVAILAQQLGADSGDLLNSGNLRRFRAGTVTAQPYPRSRRVQIDVLQEAARRGAAFLLRHQSPDGRYTYLYDARRGRSIGGDAYSMPRHSGTTHFLAQVDRALDMPEARAGALRALNWIRRHALRRCGAADRLCVEHRGRVNVGSAALTALAAAEILQKEDEPWVRRMLKGLTAFLRSMQRPDGELMHVYDLAANRPVDVQRLYFSGEAAFALLNAFRVLEDRRDLDMARKLMKHLTGAGWSFFGSRYYYGEEHWTCQAAAEASKHMDVSDAFDFCIRWAAFNRKIQYSDTSPWPIDGAYGVGPVLLPRLTPVASRSEALVSIYELAQKRGHDTGVLRNQIERSLSCLLRYQWDPGPAHLFFDPRAALGAVPGSPLDLTSRNDFVQHAGAAMLRWAQVMRRADTSI